MIHLSLPPRFRPQGVFDEPVDLREYPDYMQYVSMPISLKDIYRKAEDYATATELLDVSLLVS